MKRLIGILEKLPDPRQPWKIKHSMAELILICILAILSNANSTHEIHLFARHRAQWLSTLMPLPNGIPGRLTINRVLSMLNARMFTRVFGEFMETFRTSYEGSFVAFDGKAYHSAHQDSGGADIFYMVNAWCANNGLTLGMERTDTKENEIVAIPRLLETLDIKGAVATIDAIGCQQDIVHQIVKKNKADYAIGLKKNQPTMYNEFALYASDCLSSPELSSKYTTVTTRNKAHGRIEKREYFLFHDISWFCDRKKWTGLAGFLMVRSTRERIGKTAPTTETRFYITSLTDVRTASKAVRSHWGIENNLHWVLDVVFHEDDWATRKENVAANLAVIRRLTANLLKMETESGLTTPLKRFRCSMDLDFLESVLFPNLWSS